jgi:2-polyprenyl-3-methyl-5-hydroxy-6-metoxy-1,4-benzoquinol methylase
MIKLPATEADYLSYQYDDSEKLRIRIETHQRFTVGDTDFNAALLEHIRPVAGQELLDVGCGPGLQHAVLRTQGLRVIGIDLSLGMLREARWAMSAGQYAQANALALPFRDKQFDRVLCSGVLYHVRDWMTALRAAPGYSERWPDHHQHKWTGCHAAHRRGAP